ncbi:MAG: hypothetical protein JWO25_363 [Alphaproteobacteria bacterium]|nr:hypothetical protein [Alphaproteobacteria bacterium]
MKEKLIAAGLTALTLLAAGVAGAAPSTGPGRHADISRAELTAQVDARFDRLDANHDGKIDASDRAASIEARFKRLDADGNGSVTLAEMQAAEANGDAATGHSHAGAPGRRGRHAGNFIGPDGTTKAQAEAKALARFDRGDADHNGVLTAAERQQTHAGSKAAR